MIRKLHQLQDHMEPTITESKELNQAPKHPTMLVSDDSDIVTAGNNKLLLLVKVKQTSNLTKAVKHTY